MTLKEQAFEMFEQGRTPVYIAKVLGCNSCNIYRYCKDWNAMHPDRPIKGRQAVIDELRAKGLTDEEIAKETGYTLRAVRTREKKPSGKKTVHLCRTCIYGCGGNESDPKCNYIGITGHMRGCKAENCEKYHKGRRIRRTPFEYE